MPCHSFHLVVYVDVVAVAEGGLVFVVADEQQAIFDTPLVHQF